MIDEELVEFVRSMMSSMELRMERRFKAQLKELDAIFERYCPSTEALLDSSSQPDSSEVDNHSDAPVESVRSEMDLDDPEEALDIAVDVDLIRDGSKAQPKLNRSSPEVEEKLSARMEIGDSRISPALDRAIRSSCMYIEEGTPWEWFHMLLTEQRWIFDRGRGAKLIDDELSRAVTGGRREAWSRRIAELHWRNSPTVADTKLNFLKSYKRPIPSVYNSVLQELLVQQHLIKYKKSYSYDPIFALGFVTVYDQLMDGYPSDEDREAIFQAYIKALNEDPEKYRADSQKLEEWARAQNSSSLVEFSSKEGEVEEILKDISERAANGNFSYSRFFAVGLFRLLELSNATEPTILEKLCTALNINKRSVDRDLDVYRNLLSKLVQAKELLKEYVAREKK
ncbi:hypothetical protein G4B88_023424 [Cannabis sativa]|uniref:Uncharacterized protein n=1 Tax=Cannabis sativa TaxID=3483 RepID=A0A7J6DN71_CANSA|nr:hypothetical protein G4B88_023424 [Cannabis sativa]